MSDVRIGSGIRAQLADEILKRYPGAGTVGQIIDADMLSAWMEAEQPFFELPSHLAVLGYSAHEPETNKTAQSLTMLWDRFIGLRRDEPLIVVGGGATTDLGGFAAATLRRGIPWVALPTTVVGMADAAIGGKTGINHAAGKNLIGAFHEPELVLIDVDFLQTLDPRELRAGAAELYKAGRLGDGSICTTLAGGLPDVSDTEAWISLIGRAVAVKQDHVQGDLRDTGKRRLLNYGHTIGHGLETLYGHHAMRHGEGVSIGMQAAMHISAARGLVGAGAPALQRAALQAMGLPTETPADLPVDELMRAIAYDKKRSDGGEPLSSVGMRHTFVLPTGEVGAEIASDVLESEIRAALAAIAG